VKKKFEIKEQETIEDFIARINKTLSGKLLDHMRVLYKTTNHLKLGQDGTGEFSIAWLIPWPPVCDEKTFIQNEYRRSSANANSPYRVFIKCFKVSWNETKLKNSVGILFVALSPEEGYCVSYMDARFSKLLVRCVNKG
jgi:hypothetical protein